MQPLHRIEMAASLLLNKFNRRAFNDDGAMTTEMMIITAALSMAALMALGLLRLKISSAASNINTNPSN